MTTPEARNLTDRLPDTVIDDSQALDIFIEWTMDRGVELYPAQEEAFMELMAGKNVILKTPTGSGKSLVATAMHFRALARDERSVYTSPIKALVSEKFFALCKDFGAANVGMMTGDASVNRDAPILACTAEVLASMSLREGETLDVQHVVMDEFHYYADRDRGMAWQVPLLTLPQATFLLMSATLGDTESLERDLKARTGRDVALVQSSQRPVPLDFRFCQVTLQEAVTDLLESGRAPIYIVNFSQREAAEEAQSLTSVPVLDREGRQAVAEALGGFRFDSPYGKDIQRFVRHGIGVHHAGLLPKYRLLVEKLAQKGLLKVISGTDTLGVGVNVPIRTVLFTKLCKYDGEKTRILTVRDFLQIAGRAGRKGFDTQGWVVALAPEHVVENQKLEAKVDGKKFKKKSAPDKGYVPWDEKTFDALIGGTPEALTSVFKLDHGIMVSLLQSAETRSQTTRGGGYRTLLELIEQSHERPGRKSWLRKEARRIFKSLVQAGVVEVVPRGPSGLKAKLLGTAVAGRDVRVSRDLQDDFSLHHTLSLFLVFALHRQDPESESYALDALTLVESILESPKAILERQADKAKRLMIEQLKAEGVPFEERIEKIQDISWPQPKAEAVWALFETFLESHPWADGEHVRVKGIAREMAENFMMFNDFVKEYGLERIEGVLLRYLSDVYKTFAKNVPDELKTDAVWELLGYLRTLLTRADSSLVQEWEQLRDGVPAAPEAIQAPRPIDLADNPKALLARVRAELHALVKALAEGDWEEAAALVAPEGVIATPEAFEAAITAFRTDHGALRFDHAARLPDKTRIAKLAERHWEATQVLVGSPSLDLDPDDVADDTWAIVADIDLTGGPVGPDARLLSVQKIG